MPRIYSNLGPARKSRNFNVPMTEKDMQRIQRIAEDAGMTKTQLARKFLLEAMEKAEAA